jgi:precorrin-4/cobalt-precorrin-4 C11-methyltransferase
MKQCSNYPGRKSYLYPVPAVLLFMTLFFPVSANSTDAGLYLVGLGPGDPDLATVRALELIQNSDLIYTFGGDILERFDRYLKGKEIRELQSGVFTRYYMRKSDQGDADLENERRSMILGVRQAVSEGRKVVFIDNGDPLIYGPWAWMLQEFQDIGIEVVPGISSFNAGLAALGRDPTWSAHTHSVLLTTDRPQSQDRLEELAALQCSMVIFTHLTKFEEIIRKLRSRYSPQTPISIVLYAGFKDRESVITGNLENIESKVQPDTLPFENIIFVGDFLTY